MTLLHRLAQANGPDRELLVDVCRALGWERGARYSMHGGNPRGIQYWRDPDTRREVPESSLPDLFGSLDAVLRLLPEGWAWQVTRRQNGTFGAVVADYSKFNTADFVYEDCDGATHAIALLIAIVMAWVWYVTGGNL